MDYALELHELRKSYRDVVALDGLTLRVPRGSVFGLVGRNGAGKTTTLNLLVGLLHPDAGWARIDGHDAHRDGPRARRAIAFVPEEGGLYPWLSVEETARYWRRLSGTWDESAFRHCLERFDLPRKRTVVRLSKGMRTQLLLALAVAKQPRTYILDEPTSGLDPVVRRHVLRFLDEEARREGRTVVLSSHVLSELNDICTHVAVIDRGRLKLESDMGELRTTWRKYTFSSDGHNLDSALRALAISGCEVRGDTYSVYVRGDHEQTLLGLRALPISDLQISEMQLDEIFFTVLGAGGGDAGREPLRR